MSTRETVYNGRVIDLGIEAVELPGGLATELEIIRHPGGAVALAINARDEVCLLRQYRHAAGGWLWELPGGRVEDGEAPLLSAQRELQEEAGIEARDWRPLMTLWSTPGFCTEQLHLFVATELRVGTANVEADEVLEVHWLPLQRALAMCDAGEITDAKTLAGLYRWQRECTA